MRKEHYLVFLFLFVTGTAGADQKSDPAAAKSDPPIPATEAMADQPIFKIGGFGTLGFTHSSLNSGDYVTDNTVPKGAGRSSDWSAGNNSRMAVHLNANFSPKVSALFQVDSEYHADGTYRPEVEWISLKYSFTPNVYLRAGRIVLPTFMDSENRDVGYSYTWVHPPVDLYHQLSIPSSDGVDGMYRSEIGDAVNTVKVIYGKNTVDRPNSVTTSRDMEGVFDTLEYGQVTLHAGYQERQSSTRNDLTGLTGAWTRNSDLSLGALYDPGDWFVMSEWIQRKSTYKAGAMYVSAGYRINKFTPYLTHSQNSPGSLLQNSPPPTASAVQFIERAQSTDSVGVRWDFMRNFDCKVQYDRVTLSDNSNGYLINVPANLVLYGTTFHVISTVVDFVF